MLFGCADKKAQEQLLLDSVIQVHDRVMGEDDRLLNNKLLLDSMVKYNSTADVKDAVYGYVDQINLADSAMDTWMNKFDADLTKKPADENINYLRGQKKIIVKIDSQMKAVLAPSSKYLLKWNMK